MTGPPGMNADGSMTGMPVEPVKTGTGIKYATDFVEPVKTGTGIKYATDFVEPVKTGTGIKYGTDFVEPVNGKGGDGTAGSNNAGEVTGVNGWDGIQRGGE